MGATKMEEKFRSLDYSFIESVILPLDVTRQKKMAEHLFKYYEVYGKLNLFIEWTIKMEIENTPRVYQVLREDGFTVHFINMVLFGDCGIRYLNYLITPIIDDLEKDITPLEMVKTPLNEHHRTSMNRLMLLINSLIVNLKKSILHCPIMIRWMMFNISKQFDNSKSKMEGSMDTCFILNFFFFKFFCPVLTNPIKYGIVEKLDNNTANALGYCSILLNDVSLKNDTKWSLVVNKWITDQYRALYLFIYKLIDKNDIIQHKIVVESSMSIPKYSKDDFNRESRFVKQPV